LKYFDGTLAIYRSFTVVKEMKNRVYDGLKLRLERAKGKGIKGFVGWNFWEWPQAARFTTYVCLSSHRSFINCARCFVTTRQKISDPSL